jgi:uncharacterized membrane protein YedE/YeeE
MTLDWMHFTPLGSLLGGAMIGLASAMMILLIGRIPGISGILGGLLDADDRTWRAAFVAGLVAAPLLWRLVAPLPPISIPAGAPLLIVAGLLVGFGTRMGSGCTSGHGVCGLARLSPRSLAAVMTFMAIGFATVFLLRHGGVS